MLPYRGDCESSRTQVNIALILLQADIPNIITPNNYGINDYWQINGIESYPNAEVQVFTRYGQKVFESKGYTKPFDGTYNGQKLPVIRIIILLTLTINVICFRGA